MRTLLLDTVAWDLVIDASGNIAVASEPYSLAQDAASAIRLFQGELWYDTAPGIPYFENILGKSINVPYLKSQFVEAALRVPGVVSARAFINGIENRRVTGQIQVSDESGQTTAANF